MLCCRFWRIKMNNICVWTVLLLLVVELFVFIIIVAVLFATMENQLNKNFKISIIYTHYMHIMHCRIAIVSAWWRRFPSFVSQSVNSVGRRLAFNQSQVYNGARFKHVPTDERKLTLVSLSPIFRFPAAILAGGRMQRFGRRCRQKTCSSVSVPSFVCVCVWQTAREPSVFITRWAACERR